MIKDSRLSAARLMLLGLCLTALPLGAVTAQALRLASGRPLTLPATITATQNDILVPLAQVTTPLRAIDTDDVSGDNRFAPGDIAFVFVSRSQGVVYPFAILRRMPAGKDANQDTLMLRARVTKAAGSALTLSYSFDTVSPPHAFIKAAEREPLAPIKLTLAVSDDGRAAVSSFHVGDKRFNQRVITKGVVPGRSITMASTAPQA